MIRFFKQSGTASMAEIVVTSIIFIAAAVGIITTTSSFRPKAAESSKELFALYEAKSFIQTMRAGIGGHTYVNGCSPLAPGNYTNEFGNGILRIDYSIFDEDPSDPDNPCSLNMVITWPE